MKKVVGIISVILSGSYLLPQIVRIIRRQSADDISRIAFCMQFVSCGCFLWYCVLIQDMVLVAMAGLNLVEIATILAFTFVYRHHAPSQLAVRARHAQTTSDAVV